MSLPGANEVALARRGLIGHKLGMGSQEAARGRLITWGEESRAEGSIAEMGSSRYENREQRQELACGAVGGL